MILGVWVIPVEVGSLSDTLLSNTSVLSFMISFPLGKEIKHSYQALVKYVCVIHRYCIVDPVLVTCMFAEVFEFLALAKRTGYDPVCLSSLPRGKGATQIFFKTFS